MAKFAVEKKASKYPSEYGSHKSMISVDLVLKTTTWARIGLKNYRGQLIPFEEVALLKDDAGLYITDSKVLDSGMADPNRYGNAAVRVSKEDVDVKPIEIKEEVKDESTIAQTLSAV